MSGLVLEIESCHDCPRLNKTKVSHFLMGANEYGWRYTCTKAGRDIYPSEGINPPPEWCPLRKEEDGQNNLGK